MMSDEELKLYYQYSKEYEYMGNRYRKDKENIMTPQEYAERYKKIKEVMQMVNKKMLEHYKSIYKPKVKKMVAESKERIGNK